MRIESYRDLEVWQLGIDLAEDVYRLSRDWPREELYGLTSQARRAATSVPSNVAEGYGRQSTRSYIYFLKTARGSLKELETHLIIAERVGVSEPSRCQQTLALADRIGRMLNGLISKLDERH